MVKCLDLKIAFLLDKFELVAIPPSKRFLLFPVYSHCDPGLCGLQPIVNISAGVSNSFHGGQCLQVFF